MNSLPSKSAAGEIIKPWYAQRWPWLLMLGPFLVVVAGSYTIWLAFTKQDALVVDDYYKQGQAINQDLRRDRAASQLALTADLRYDASAGKLLGDVSSHEAPYTGTLFVSLVHSTLPEKDIKLIVHPDTKGAFSVALPLLGEARWRVIIENEMRDWRLSGIWKWPHQPTVELKADAIPRG